MKTRKKIKKMNKTSNKNNKKTRKTRLVTRLAKGSTILLPNNTPREIDIVSQKINDDLSIKPNNKSYSPSINRELVTLKSLSRDELLDCNILKAFSLKEPIKGRFYLFKMSNREILGDRSVVYELHFIDQRAVIDLNKKGSNEDDVIKKVRQINNDVKIVNVSDFRGMDIKSNLLGTKNYENLLRAYLCAKVIGIDENTALIHENGWSIVGKSGVHHISSEEPNSYFEGDNFDLELAIKI